MKFFRLLTAIAFVIGSFCQSASAFPGPNSPPPSLQFIPQRYGATGDGVLRTISSVLGVSTLAGLQAYQAADGSTPYALIGTSPYGRYVALPSMGTLASGATTVPFYTTVTVGAAGAASGVNYIPIVNNGTGNLRPGMKCAGTGIASGAAITAISGANSTLEFLFATTTAALASGATFTCGMDIATSKLKVGAAVTGAGQAAGTTIASVVTTPGAQAITLSNPMTAGEPMFTAIETWVTYTDAEIAAASMDWLGLQTALIQGAISNGGEVKIPRGNYRLNLGLIQPGSTVDRYNVSGPVIGTQVDMVGSGRINTALVMTVDLGPGAFALTCAFRITNAGQCRGKWEDFGISGTIPTTTAGRAQVAMNGLGEGGHRDISRVNVTNFYAGLAITSDQTRFSSMDIYQNYYGVYFDLQDTYGNFGDHYFDEILLQSSAQAGIAMSPLFISPGDHWARSGVFNSPFGIFKETLVGQGNTIFLREDSFWDFQMESIGHALVGDDRAYGTSINTNQYVEFHNLEPIWSSGTNARIQYGPGSTYSQHGAFFEMGTCDDCRVVAMAEANNWQPGTDGMFDITSTTQFTIDGDVDQLLTNIRAIGAPAVKQLVPNTVNPLNWRLLGNGWEGTVVNGCGSVAVNVLCTVPAAGGAAAVSTGTAGEQLVGVSAGLTATYQVVKTRGRVILPVDSGSATVPSGGALRTAAAGAVTLATGSNDATTPYLGRAQGAVAPGGNAVIFLQGMQ